MSIIFIPSGHRYIHEESNQELTPATELISQFFEKFDTERWSRHIALRDKRSVQDVLDDWEQKKQASCDFGTAVHAFAQSLIMKTKSPIPKNRSEMTYFNAVTDFIKSEGFEFFEAEKVIGSLAHGIAGQIDALSKKKNKIFLIDWKTNRSIDLRGYNDKRALEPISNLQDCNFSKYSLQLSLYRYILEKEYNLKAEGQILVHLTPDGSYYKYDVDYLKDEVEAMLAYSGRL